MNVRSTFIFKITFINNYLFSNSYSNKNQTSKAIGQETNIATSFIAPAPEPEPSIIAQSISQGTVNINSVANSQEMVKQARMQGYEGESCPECQNFTLVRNGTCLKCNTCGSTTGCS